MKVNFDKNHNGKLDLEIFTTIRAYSPEKFHKLKTFANTLVNIFLDKKKYCEATLINLDVRKFCEMPFGLVMMDTGLTLLVEIMPIMKACGIEDMQSNVMILTFQRKDL
jgi:hypothetical protein